MSPQTNPGETQSSNTSHSPISAHKTPKVEEFLRAHPNVHLHYTPTYSSWLNQVELWFAKIECA